MNAARAALREALRTSDRAILTFGTAWVYERNGAVVANCHRCPAAEFAGGGFRSERSPTQSRHCSKGRWRAKAYC